MWPLLIHSMVTESCLTLQPSFLVHSFVRAFSKCLLFPPCHGEMWGDQTSHLLALKVPMVSLRHRPALGWLGTHPEQTPPPLPPLTHTLPSRDLRTGPVQLVGRWLLITVRCGSSCRHPPSRKLALPSCTAAPWVHSSGVRCPPHSIYFSQFLSNPSLCAFTAPHTDPLALTSHLRVSSALPAGWLLTHRSMPHAHTCVPHNHRCTDECIAASGPWHGG